MRTFLGTAGAVTVFGAAMLAAVTPAAAAEIAVWRGSTLGTGLPQPVQVRHGVTEIRGTVATEAGVATSAPPAVAQPVVVAGGARVWIYDPQTGRLTVCRDAPTATIGVSVIDCHATRRDL